MLYAYDVNNLLMVISYSLPQYTQESMVRFFYVTIDNTTEIKIRPIPDIILSANSLDYDYFEVSAMTLLPNSTIVVFAIENYGILLYDIV